MGTYRVEWPCCDSVTETDAWEPSKCPICELQSEKARADAAEAKVAALEAGMRGLVDGWKRLAGYEDEHGELEIGDESATRLLRCADELSALLNRPADGGK